MFWYLILKKVLRAPLFKRNEVVNFVFIDGPWVFVVVGVPFHRRPVVLFGAF
jgi:hypothetical protein